MAHIAISVSWLAASVSLVEGLYHHRQRSLQRVELLKAQLDAQLITSLDSNGDGVDRLEFVVGMLIALGAEVGGHKLRWKGDCRSTGAATYRKQAPRCPLALCYSCGPRDRGQPAAPAPPTRSTGAHPTAYTDVVPFLNKFEALDKDCSGFIDSGDLEAMVREDREKILQALIRTEEAAATRRQRTHKPMQALTGLRERSHPSINASQTSESERASMDRAAAEARAEAILTALESRREKCAPNQHVTLYVVQFESGDEHKYVPSSLHKFSLADGEPLPGNLQVGMQLRHPKRGNGELIAIVDEDGRQLRDSFVKELCDGPSLAPPETARRKRQDLKSGDRRALRGKGSRLARALRSARLFTRRKGDKSKAAAAGEAEGASRAGAPSVGASSLGGVNAKELSPTAAGGEPEGPDARLLGSLEA